MIGLGASFWNTMAMSRCPGPTSLVPRPTMRMLTAVMSSSPAIMRRSVDSPQPEGPTRTRQAASDTSAPTPRRVPTLPKGVRRSVIVTSAPGAPEGRAMPACRWTAAMRRRPIPGATTGAAGVSAWLGAAAKTARAAPHAARAARSVSAAPVLRAFTGRRGRGRRRCGAPRASRPRSAMSAAAPRARPTGRSANLAIVLPDIANPFVPPLMEAAQAVAGRADHGVFPGCSGKDPRQEERLVERVAGQVDGGVPVASRRPGDRIRHRAGRRPRVLASGATAAGAFDDLLAQGVMAGAGQAQRDGARPDQHGGLPRRAGRGDRPGADHRAGRSAKAGGARRAC